MSIRAEIIGDVNIARHIASQHVNAHLMGEKAADSVAVERWLHVAGQAITEPQVDTINTILTLRTFLVGTHTATLADVALWDAIHAQPEISKYIQQKSEQLPHIARWLRFLDSLKDFGDVLRKAQTTKPVAASKANAPAAKGSAPEKPKAQPRKTGEVNGPQDVC